VILRDYDFERHTIQDPIHGAITFGAIEAAVIDHPLFQRLHGLRQNSLLYLVFPAANHTRFDHSLGVMYLADRFLEKLLNNQRHICKAGIYRTSYQDPYRVDDSTIFETIEILHGDNYFRLAIRIAALFHDIGHGPLSHLFDKFFPSWNEIQNFTTEPGYKHIHECFSQIPEDKKNEPIRHETLSCIIATRVLLDCTSALEEFQLDPSKMVKDICAIIDDQLQPSMQLLGKHYKFHPLLHDILSSDIDVDRMDYLLRDSHMCGVNYGLYDPHRILKSMCAYGRTDSQTLRVGVRHSGLGALEDLLLSRYQMHSHIYGHKTNRACGTMLEAIRKRLKESKWKWYGKCHSLSDLLKKFLDLNDHAFVSELRLETIDNGKGKVKEISEKLFIERKLFKRVWERRFRMTDQDKDSTNEAKRQWEEIQKLLKENNIRFTEDSFDNKGPKLNTDQDPAIKVLKKDLKKRHYLVHEIKKLSSVAKFLPRIESTYRIYCKESYLEKARNLLPD